MKILADVDSNTILCEVKKDEVAAVFNEYAAYNLPKDFFDIGNKINLGEGYSFKNELKRLLESFTSSHDNFIKCNNTLMKFAELAGENKKEKVSDEQRD